LPRLNLPENRKQILVVKKDNYHNSEPGRRHSRTFEMSAEIQREGENTSMIKKDEARHSNTPQDILIGQNEFKSAKKKEKDSIQFSFNLDKNIDDEDLNIDLKFIDEKYHTDFLNLNGQNNLTSE
tara:strand:- start:246 stop:620 length:375 start_codon:yes stop_codon:yes gene_type:complete